MKKPLISLLTILLATNIACLKNNENFKQPIESTTVSLTYNNNRIVIEDYNTNDSGIDRVYINNRPWVNPKYKDEYEYHKIMTEEQVEYMTKVFEAQKNIEENMKKFYATK